MSTFHLSDEALFNNKYKMLSIPVKQTKPEIIPSSTPIAALVPIWVVSSIDQHHNININVNIS